MRHCSHAVVFFDQVMQALVDSYPDDADPWYSLGQLCIELGDMKRARLAFSNAERLLRQEQFCALNPYQPLSLFL